MSGPLVIYPFHTNVFFRPENAEVVSNNLWKPLEKEEEQRFEISRPASWCLGIPNHGIGIQSFETYTNSILCRCTTESETELEPTIKFEICLQHRLTSAESEQMIELSKDLDVDVLVTACDIYSRKMESKGKRVLYILGSEARVTAAKPHVIALLELFNNKIMQYVHLESPALIPVCAGANLNNLKSFRDLYGTKVIIPDISDTGADSIFLSGDAHFSVLMAKERLENMLAGAKDSFYHAQLPNVSSLKLQFLNRFRQRQITTIIEKHQCYIKVEESTVSFVATSEHALSSALRQFTLEILMPVLEAQFAFQDQTGGYSSQDNLELQLDQIASNRNILIAQLNPPLTNFVLIGASQDIAKATASIEKLNIPGNVQIRYLLELHPEYRDFISGKKNGKITRIMENAKCSIALESQENASNMCLSLISDSFADAKIGVQLLNDELPAEDSFFIPEAYHRPIIGTRGSVIQTIMRRYNVFIQFSNTYQSHQNDIGLNRHDNVIIRCPYKNRKSIPAAKEELKRIVAEYSELQPKAYLKLSLGQYRYYFQETRDHKHNVIGEIEKKTGAYILFPTEIPGKSVKLEVRGNDQTAAKAAHELMALFASERQITVDSNISDAADFSNQVVASLKKGMNVDTTLDGNTVSLNYKNIDDKQMEKALEILKNYITSKGMQIKSDVQMHPHSIFESDLYPPDNAAATAEGI
ncbi:LANO_0F09054g1_1 [Lachancea nothofagi CBS 11611]|uniref:LANO_0F09054g1_1 n=1 Tax=Lachancea nothofagi CBS 11611 TaxID=1266666 RepID=A0A1G4K9Q0_9SACH|nr:LANO_0F09054g1_1 [Lachancea nothofagi CBS 11611]